MNPPKNKRGKAAFGSMVFPYRQYNTISPIGQLLFYFIGVVHLVYTYFTAKKYRPGRLFSPFMPLPYKYTICRTKHEYGANTSLFCHVPTFPGSSSMMNRIIILVYLQKKVNQPLRISFKPFSVHFLNLP